MATREILEPQQIILSRAGPAIFVFSTRETLELKRGVEDWVAVKADLTNAHNQFFRAETIQCIENEPRLRHMASYAGVILSPESGLEAGGKLWGRAREAGTQGDPSTGDLFAITLQPSLVRLDRACRAGGGLAMAGADDIVAQGPREVVMRALKDFETELKQRCGLELNWGKTTLFSWGGELPEDAPSDLKLAGKVVDGVFRRGFECWGVPVGESEFVASFLDEKITEIAEESAQALDLLSANKQASWAVLKWSVWARFDFWAQLCYPSDTMPAAKRLDDILWQRLEAVCGLSLPRQSTRETSSWDCPLDVPVQGRSDWTYCAWLARQPVKRGGMGLRSYVELCRPAFIGALEQSLPRLWEGFCPLLEAVVGGAECFGEEVAWEGRWRVLLQSGHRVGQEFLEAWSTLKVEAEQAAAWLGREVEGPLAEEVSNAGSGSTSGSTRNLIQEQREELMGKLLSKALDQNTDQSARPVWAFPQRDKHSSQFLLVLPGHDLTLTSSEFTECVAAMLCVPSPGCASKIGERFCGRTSVDKFGDKIMAAKMAGDGFRKRHDAIKGRITRLHKWAGVKVECEVFGLFAGHIPQAGLSRLEKGRKRQGMVPDFRVDTSLPGAGGDTRDTVEVLAELKCISSCPTRYLRDPREPERAVNSRACKLPGEYLSHARTLDQKFGDVAAGVQGPVEAKLLSFPPVRGWVFGAFGEASDDVHEMAHFLATSRLKHQQTLEGKGRSWRSDAGELAILTGQVRRALGLEAVRAQARCLISRLDLIGAGAAAASKRRQWAAREEWRMARERTANFLSLTQGHPLIRRGQFLEA